MDSNKVLMIISICAIFSPAITSVIDNIFKIYLNHKREAMLEKRKALNEFVDATMECITHSNQDDEYDKPDINKLKRYYKASKTLLLYFPLKLNEFDILDNQIKFGTKESILTYSKDIIEKLSDYAKK